MKTSCMTSLIQKIWEAIYNVPDEEIWKTRMTMKNKLVDYIRKSVPRNVVEESGDPSYRFIDG